jgi:hypothetical protein
MENLTWLHEQLQSFDKRDKYTEWRTYVFMLLDVRAVSGGGIRITEKRREQKLSDLFTVCDWRHLLGRNSEP